MSYTMEDFQRDYFKEQYAKLTPEKRRELVQSLPPEERRKLLESLPLEQRPLFEGDTAARHEWGQEVAAV